MTRVSVVEPGYCPYQAAFDSPQAAISEVIEGRQFAAETVRHIENRRCVQ